VLALLRFITKSSTSLPASPTTATSLPSALHGCPKVRWRWVGVGHQVEDRAQISLPLLTFPGEMSISGLKVGFGGMTSVEK